MAEIRPQPGFQEKVLACTADIAVIGGEAGPGKTWAMLAEPLHHMTVEGFGATIFRNSYPEIFNPGQLWDKSKEIYPLIGGKPVVSKNKWLIDKIYVAFSYLENDTDCLSWLGAELPFIGFEELFKFSKYQFIFMLSRNRSTCGVKPYVRATTNPIAEGWVRELVDWYIGEDGYPIPARDGVHRFLMVWKDEFIWGDSKEEVRDKNPDFFNTLKPGQNYRNYIKSFTFIKGARAENKILADKDPSYEANLLMQDQETYNRYGLGNWNTAVEDLRLFDSVAVKDVFSNPVEVEKPRLLGYSTHGLEVWSDPKKGKRYITCDAARFGRDLCVIFVWDGWHIIFTSIFKQSDTQDIVNEIERLRTKFGVRKSYVMVDADGVGGDTVDFGDYRGFHGGHAAMKDQKVAEERRLPENYKNLKTQCYYRYAARINRAGVTYTVIADNVMIFETPGKGVLGRKISLKGKIWDVIDLIKDDFRAIRRAEVEKDGSIFKKCINSKEEQKIILNGRSPDFADAGSIREAFELVSDFEGEIEVDN